MRWAVIKQVFRVLDEIVHTDSDSVIEQRQVQTDVCLVGLFPFQVRIGQGGDSNAVLAVVVVSAICQ